MSPVNEDTDPADIALNKYVNHPSILKIKKYFNKPIEFNISELIPNDTEKEIKKTMCSNKGTFKNITPKSLKEPADVCSPLLLDIWAKEIVRKRIFPEDFQNADVTPVFTKDSPLLAKNCRPLSALSAVSKIFQRLM